MTEKRSGLPVLGFADQRSFERWLAAQPADAVGVWIKFAKKAATRAKLTKTEAIDAALCHGWIDGKLEKYDDQHWLVRFTPRKSRSKWSALNRNRALTLIKEGRMRPAGFAQIEAAKADGRWEGAYAPASRAEVPIDLQKALDDNPKASAFLCNIEQSKSLRNPVSNRQRQKSRDEGAQDCGIRSHARAWRNNPRVGKMLIIACRSRRAKPT
jgi:uncharacterized protein YdeI (YjbR/CyaY-like superfamily)